MPIDLFAINIQISLIDYHLHLFLFIVFNNVSNCLLFCIKYCNIYIMKLNIVFIISNIDGAIDLYIIDAIGFVTLHALNLSLKYLILKIHIYSFDVYQFYLN